MSEKVLNNYEMIKKNLPNFKNYYYRKQKSDIDFFFDRIRSILTEPTKEELEFKKKIDNLKSLIKGLEFKKIITYFKDLSSEEAERILNYYIIDPFKKLITSDSKFKKYFRLIFLILIHLVAALGYKNIYEIIHAKPEIQQTTNSQHSN